MGAGVSSINPLGVGWGLCLFACRVQHGEVPLRTFERLQDDDVHTKYGFLYDNYDRRFPYWETTEMLRKFAIAFIPVSRLRLVCGALHAGAGASGRLGAGQPALAVQLHTACGLQQMRTVSRLAAQAHSLRQCTGCLLCPDLWLN